MLFELLVKLKNFLKTFRPKKKIDSQLAVMHVFGDPSTKLKIVGVTGTNGKTTTTTLLYRIAIALGYRAGLIGTVENIINGERLATNFTTPEPAELNRLLNRMVDAGCEYVFMEVSSHGMDQGRVAGVTFYGGIFTNLTHDHLDYHKTFENYFNAKKKFFNMLPRGAFALSNADDPNGKRMLEDTKAETYFYGFSPSAGTGEAKLDFKGEIKKLDFDGLELGVGTDIIRSKLLGKFNAYNMLAVWSASRLLGFDLEKVKRILEDIKPPRGRFEHFTSPSGVLAIVDYAHTPDALEKIITAVKEVRGGVDLSPLRSGGAQAGRLIAIFGCGGDRDPLKRPTMGKIGASMADIAIFTTDNPRSEDPQKIIEDMKTGLSESELQKVRVIANRKEAIIAGVALAQPGDIILCAGKGHETYQEVKGVKSHFDDLEELKAAFQLK